MVEFGVIFTLQPKCIQFIFLEERKSEQIRNIALFPNVMKRLLSITAHNQIDLP